MKASQLRDRITIERIESLTDRQGGRVIDWRNHLENVPAKVIPKTASQILFTDSLQQRITHTVYIRDYPGIEINTSMRISFDNRTLHIQGIKKVSERGKFIEISANEGAGS